MSVLQNLNDFYREAKEIQKNLLIVEIYGSLASAAKAGEASCYYNGRAPLDLVKFYCESHNLKYETAGDKGIRIWGWA